VSRFGALVMLGWLVALAGCGGSSAFAPPPVGTFNNASFNGAYAFSFSGTNSLGFFSMAGSLQADGNGHIIAGVEDVNSASGVFTNLSISFLCAIPPTSTANRARSLGETCGQLRGDAGAAGVRGAVSACCRVSEQRGWYDSGI